MPKPTNNFYFLPFLILVFTLASVCPLSVYSQSGKSKRFYLESGKKSEKIPITLSGNQIVVSVEINDSKPLNFILDSGVKTPIIIDVPDIDTLELRNSERTEVRGLGRGDGIEAIIAHENRLVIGGSVVNENQTVLVLLEDLFHLSNKLGYEIHGIMGYDVFRDFVVEINYDYHYIKLHNPKTFKHPKSRRYVVKDLEFYKGKPYVYLDAHLPQDTVVPVKLLVDTGGSDALWLFIDSHEEIDLPEKHIPDFLGTGLSGDIFGKRSRIPGLYVGDHKLEDVTVSYPDSSSVSYVMMHKERNGSIGGAALSRFKVIIDYSRKKISFKKSSKFRDEFNYNMSGLAIKMPYEGLPIYEVSSVREGSAAEKAGVMVGDQISYINGIKTTSIKFPDLMHMFREREGKRIKLILYRGGEKVKANFRLEKNI